MTTTDTLAIFRINGKYVFGWINGGTDGATEVALSIVDDQGGTQTLGQAFEGQRLEGYSLQCSDGSILSTHSVRDDAGGKTVNDQEANERLVGSPAPVNVKTELALNISRGMTFYLATAD